MKSEYSIISYGRAYNPVNWYYNPNHVVNRFYYIVDGTAYYQDRVLLKPGFMYIFRAMPYFKVSQSNEDPTDHVFFDFLTHKRLLNTDYIEINPSDYPMLKNLLEAIKEDFTNHPTQPSHVISAYMELLMYYLKDHLAQNSSYSEVTESVLQLLHNTAVAELSVNQIATQLNRNVNHVIRCFKKEIGITPHKYIAMLKTDLAVTYLKQGMSCTEIAEALGFSSLSAFSYFFKQETGKNISECLDL